MNNRTKYSVECDSNDLLTAAAVAAVVVAMDSILGQIPGKLPTTESRVIKERRVDIDRQEPGVIKVSVHKLQS